MTIEELPSARLAEQFKPFTMHLAYGRGLQVRHPEFLSPHPEGRAVIVFHDDGSFSIVEAFDVTEIEFQEGRPRSGHNGAKKPKKP